MAGVLTFIETDDDNAYELRSNLYNTLPIAGGITGQDRPITAMDDLDDGRMVAGVYDITFTAVSPGVSGVVTVDTTDANNPWKTTAKAVYLDDDQTVSRTGTLHMDVIGGMGLYFSNSASFDTSWAASVVVGGYFVNGIATEVLSFGNLRAGEVTTYKKIGAKNTGTTDCTNSAVGVYPGIYFKNMTNTPIERVKINNRVATAGKYNISATSITGGMADISVAQYQFNYSVGAWVVLIGSTLMGTFACDGATVHTSIISNVDVVLSDTITGDSTASVYIDTVSGAQVAPDLSGSPGTWVSTSDVVLTESGGVAGVVQPGNTAYFWLRVVSSGSDLPGNLRKFALRPSGISSGGLVE